MWSSLDRTRRRLRGSASVAAPLADAATGAPTESPPVVVDLVLAIGRPELDRMGLALQGLLGPSVARLDTPGRLEVALAAALVRLGSGGRPRVTRRPAGIYTQEAWQVRLVSIDPTVGEAIRSAIRDGVFAP
jgi:hypothetical protein